MREHRGERKGRAERRKVDVLEFNTCHECYMNVNL